MEEDDGMAVVFAYKNTEYEVMKSSSGGAFIGICKVFEMVHGSGNISFYGAVLMDDMSVQHCRVDSAEECHLFQGSKYVRSDLNSCYREVADKLTKRQWVLFSGTPCQIGVLNRFLERKNVEVERLLTIDVICHGAPKKKVWRDYIHWLEEETSSKLVEYSFRFKPEGWKAYPAYALFNNGKKLINTPKTSVYSKLHLAGYSLDKSCFSCEYAKEKRCSDITLGDYWGIEKITDRIPYKTGVSLIICNTDKGKNIVQDLDKQNEDLAIYFLETPDKKYLEGQHNLIKPTEKPTRYEEFWKEYSTEKFELILKKYINYGLKYKILFSLKRLVRKSPIIEVYRKYIKK